MAPSFCLGGGRVNAAEGGTDLLNLIPDSVTLSVKESEFVKTDEQCSYAGCKVAALVKDSVVSALTTAGLDLANYSVSAYPPMTADSGIGFFTVYVSGDGASESKVVEVKYANTANVDTDASAALQLKLTEKADARGYITSYHMYPANVAAAVIKADNEKAEEESIAVTKKLANDSAYSYYASTSDGIGTAGGFLARQRLSVYVYEGDEFYASLGFDHYYSYYDDKTVTMTEITQADKVYTEMMSQMVAKGYKTVLGAYELELTKSGKASFSLSFPVDAKYNGKAVIVLHKLADGNYEEFEGVVTNGAVSIETASLSPFMIALKETVADAGNNTGSNAGTNNGTTTTTTPAPTKKPGVGTPDTGVAAETDGSHATVAVLGSVLFVLMGSAIAAGFTGKKMIARKKEQKA